MININNCTGCSACYSICPTNCIAMEQDGEGFSYPIINDKNCTACTKCKSVCPAVIQGAAKKPLKVYAAKNPNDKIRLKSSSGGIFSLLSESIVKEGGVVFGARFNDTWDVIHAYTETINGLEAFRGSKYVQSSIGDTYRQTKSFLDNNKKVLYSGTPCQVAGLKAYLQKDYPNLLAVDFVCKGVPSPLVWKKYLREFVDITAFRQSNIKIFCINFRNKIYGWNSRLVFSVTYVVDKPMDAQSISNTVIYYNKQRKKRCDFNIVCSDKSKNLFTFFETSNTNSYMKGLLRNLYLRPSCYNCPAKSLKSGSDITIADYWGIESVLPEFNDKKGISLVLINTEKGSERYDLLDKNEHETTYADGFAKNYRIEKSVLPYHTKRALFFEKLNYEPVIPLIDKLTAVSLQIRFKKIIAAWLQRIGLLSFVNSLRKYK